MHGAKGVLFNITGGPSLGILEIQQAAQVITEAADDDAEVIWGHVLDPSMEDTMSITVIATGFSGVVGAEASSKGRSGARGRIELEEAETRLSSREEDIFTVPALPPSDIDKPPILRGGSKTPPQVVRKPRGGHSDQRS